MSNSSPIPVPITFLAVDDLAAQRQDRLVRLVAGILRGAAGRIALDDEHLGELGVAHLAVRELLRDLPAERTLATGQVTRLARCLASPRSGDRLLDDLLGVRRVLLEKLRELRVDARLDESLHPRVAELRLRLTFELRILQLHRHDRGKPFAHVLALEIVLFLLEQTHVARDLVQRAREGRVESREVRATLVCVDVVRERVDRLLIRRVPLHRNLDLALLVLGFEIGNALVDRVLRGVHMGDEVSDPTLVVELDFLSARAFVGQHDA